jgi:glutamate-1-semialdehyde 2,1-aminomutase
MFLSKRPEMYLPEKWPTYFKKSKGCKVIDLDGNNYYDLTMGVGTNILGYSNTKLNSSIKRSIDHGTMSTLNCPEEVELAEKLIDLHPWADQAKFARTGGEANAIAIRIARTYAKSNTIAICGYHGWHDWYLAANLEKTNNLSKHLLPNLNTIGVPKNLKGTVYPFDYNNFHQLEVLVKKKNIGIIKMEVARNQKPKNNFLKKISDLCKKKNIVLIFDECTSGFRECYGGLHKKYKVVPDMAIFGKSLGNGHPITAIIGKKKIMDHSQASFISSTYWSERVGYVAGLKTLEIMEKYKSWLYIGKLGIMIKKNGRN